LLSNKVNYFWFVLMTWLILIDDKHPLTDVGNRPPFPICGWTVREAPTSTQVWNNKQQIKPIRIL